MCRPLRNEAVLGWASLCRWRNVALRLFVSAAVVTTRVVFFCKNRARTRFADAFCCRGRVQISNASEYIGGNMTGELGDILIRCNNVLYVRGAE